MTTIKTLAAIALLAQSTPALASTPVTIDFDRWEAISAASERICPAATRAPDAAAFIERAAKNLTLPEKFLLLNLCLLYARGRADGMGL